MEFKQAIKIKEECDPDDCCPIGKKVEVEVDGEGE